MTQAICPKTIQPRVLPDWRGAASPGESRHGYGPRQPPLSGQVSSTHPSFLFRPRQDAFPERPEKLHGLPASVSSRDRSRRALSATLPEVCHLSAADADWWIESDSPERECRQRVLHRRCALRFAVIFRHGPVARGPSKIRLPQGGSPRTPTPSTRLPCVPNARPARGYTPGTLADHRRSIRATNQPPGGETGIDCPVRA